jgi:hypothetical protein
MTLAVVSVIWWPTPYALAQDTKIARGTVVEIGGSWLTVKVRDQQMKFTVDGKTMIEAKGAGTKSRQAAAVGKAGLKLADVLRLGQGVAVTYIEVNGALQASHVREVSSVSGGGDGPAEPESLVSIGTVQSIGANSMTITGAGGGGAAFTQTFTIDERTKVYAKGAGTAAAAKGGRLPFTQIVNTGDHVSVSHQKLDGSLRASDVRVTMKAMH